jgi:hypothetical protein
VGLLAAGVAAIAAGAALLASAKGAKGGATSGGGAGGGSGDTAPSQYIGQGNIAVQQYQMKVMENNTNATNALTNELGRLSKEKGDVLVSKAISRNPGMVTKPLTSSATRSFALQRSLGGALVGESA